jgi:hypothetical protein
VTAEKTPAIRLFREMLKQELEETLKEHALEEEARQVEEEV